MSINTSIVWQDDCIKTLQQILPDPPHIFLSGGYGSGKTTIVQDFLKAYYTTHAISPSDPEWVLWLSSEQDRGIHCVRQSVAEFVRHSCARRSVSFHCRRRRRFASNNIATSIAATYGNAFSYHALHICQSICWRSYKTVEVPMLTY